MKYQKREKHLTVKQSFDKFTEIEKKYFIYLFHSTILYYNSREWYGMDLR